MTTSDAKKEADSATLSPFARGLLLATVALAGVLFGYGFMGMDDSNGVQIAVEVVVPGLILLCTGYVFVECNASRRKC